MIFAAAASLSNPAIAHAGPTGFFGATVEFTARVSGLSGCRSHIPSNSIDAIADSEVEFGSQKLRGLQFSNPECSHYKLRGVGFSVDVGDRYVDISFQDVTPGSFGPATFNGFDLKVIAGEVPAILSYSVSTQALQQEPVVAMIQSGAGISMNVSGIAYDRASRITIGFDFDQGPQEAAFADHISSLADAAAQALSAGLSLPSEADYGEKSAMQQVAFMKEISRITDSQLLDSACEYGLKVAFVTEESMFPCSNPKSPSMQICGEEQFVEGFWKLENTTLTFNAANLQLAVKSRRNSASVDSAYRSFRNASLNNFLHEIFHRYQDCMVSRLDQRTLSKGDPRFQLATIWQDNKKHRSGPVPKRCQEFRSPAKVCTTYEAYRRQPTEWSARYFAEEVRKRWVN